MAIAVPASGDDATADWAADVANAINGLLGGSTTLVDTGYTTSSGWSIQTAHAVIDGNHVDINIALAYTGSDIDTIGSTGNIADTSLVTVPASLIPQAEVVGTMTDGYGDGAVILHPSSYSTPGLITLHTWSTGGTVTSTHTSYRCALSYTLL